MKKTVIDSITEIEDSTLAELKFEAETLGMTVREVLEQADGRRFKIYTYEDDVTLMTRKAFSESKKYGGFFSTVKTVDQFDEEMKKEAEPQVIVYDEPKQGGNFMTGSFVTVIGETTEVIDGVEVPMYLYNIDGYTAKNGKPFIGRKEYINLF